ncbi:MAG: FxsA family protein [Halanaeroarchaeum sp.]
MARSRWLFALLLVPLLDALVLIFVAAELLGGPATVALVVLTALLGLVFVRAEGRRTLRKIQRSLAAGEVPTDGLLDDGLLIAAGAFLLTPGLVTDAIGLLIVFPPTRIPLRMAIKKWWVVPTIDERSGGFATGKVYTFGFPGPDAGPGPGSRPGGETRGDETVDLGEDDYSVSGADDGFTDVEFDDERDE